MKTMLCAFGVVSLAAIPTAHALEWRLGLAYASAVSDVTDLYEDNLRIEGFDANVDLKFPLGLAAGVMYDWPSGIRGDLSLGPAFFIGGDVDHFEMPAVVTAGYNFMRDADVSPYVRAGVVHHFASGDYYSSSDPGVFFAAGLDFERFSLEVSFDGSEVEFDTFACDAAGAMCSPAVTKLNTYDVVASFFWKFRTYRDRRR